jgi:hypothetical protein
MLNQSFSPENFMKIYDLENRRGTIPNHIFLEEYKEIRGKLSHLRRDIRKFKNEWKNNKTDEYYVLLNGYKKTKEELTKKLLVQLEEDLKTLSRDFLCSTMRIKVNSPIIISEKPYYSIDSSFENFFIQKQLLWNLKRSFKIKFVDRFTIVKQAKIQSNSDLKKTIFRLDITSFYESIDISLLKKRIKDNRLLSRQSKKIIFNILSEYKKHPEYNGGVGRGISIASYLSEIYLMDFDQRIKNHEGVSFYGRYVDDIYIVYHGTEIMTFYNKIRDILEKKLKLEINRSKTNIFSIDKSNLKEILIEGKSKTLKSISFNFLGYKFEKKSAKEDIKLHLSDRKKKRVKDRISKAFLFYELSNKTYKNKWFLIHQISFLTGNVRLLNNKSNVLSGIYYSNPLLDDTSSLDDLDLFLTNKIKKSCKDESLAHRLAKYSFVNGFVSKRFVNLKKSKVPKIGNRVTGKSGLERVLSIWS